MSERERALLLELQSWLKGLPYRAPEVIAEDAVDFIWRIEALKMPHTDNHGAHDVE